MQQVIMAIHLMVVIALVVLVLYQKSEGGALGMGQSGFFTGRGQANALTRATSILGACFFVTSLLLTILPAYERRAAGGDDWTTAVDQKIELKEIKRSEGATPEAVKDKPAEPEEKGNIFDQLKRAQEKRQSLQRQPQSAPQPAASSAPIEAEKPAAAASPAPAQTDKPASAPTAHVAPEPNAPEIKSSEPAAPTAKAPETKAPEVKWGAPGTEPANGASSANAPETTAPDAKAPQTKAPEAKAPEIKWIAPGTEPPTAKPIEIKPAIDPPSGSSSGAPKN